MWFFNLLTSSSSSDAAKGGNDWVSYVLIGLVLVGVVVWLWFSNRSQKKRQEEVQNTLNAVRPGNKVKTIGGICGIVVEVCPEDNTFILETGSEATGKSYIKFDKQAIYTTDAVAKKEESAPVAEAKDETPVEETPVVEDVPADDVPAEDAPKADETTAE